MRVAWRGHIKGFLNGDFWRMTACFRRCRACAAQAEQAAAEDGGDLVSSLFRGQGIGDRVRHGLSPGSSHLSGVYLPGDDSMCRRDRRFRLLVDRWPFSQIHL